MGSSTAVCRFVSHEPGHRTAAATLLQPTAPNSRYKTNKR